MNRNSRCIILYLCLHIASPRKSREFYLSYTTVEGEGDKAGSQENRRFFWVLKGGEVDKYSHEPTTNL